jgi:lipoprotein NlpI
MRVFVLAAALLAAAVPAVAQDEKKDADVKEALKLLERAAAAYLGRKYADAIDLATKAAKLDPANPAAPFVLGSAHLALRQNAEAIPAFREAIRLDPTAAAAHDRLGDALLKSGRFEAAVGAFDRYLELRPKDAPEHWRRGIALYYAGRFEDGKKQFDLHRTVNPEDVENSAWHYLCNARATDPKRARAELIPVTKDSRVPMAQVLQLFAGKLKPQGVLDAAETAKLEGDDLTAARFYANLYVALYHESEGDADKALGHLTAAVEKYKVPDYMWDVADAHLRMLKGKKE